jgi:hypothetical protein
VSTSPATAQPEEPNVGGVKVRPPLTLALYALLVASAAVALWVQRNPAEAPPYLSRAAPWVFFAFAVGLAVYRFALAAAKRYSPFKAFFQVGVAFAVFFLLLMPNVGDGPQPSGRAAFGDLPGLLSDPDPRVRALAAELARYRGGTPALTRALVQRLTDPDPTVRKVAHQTLVQFNSGVDLGSGDDPATLRTWGERFP